MALVDVLTLRDVTKRFGDFVAVNNLSFSIAEGEVVGFLGANGAGKTTTLRMILDILRPTSGTIEVFGGPAGTREGTRNRFPARGARALSRHDRASKPSPISDASKGCPVKPPARPPAR